MNNLQTTYHKFTAKLRLYWKINWIKTLYINLKLFSFKEALKLPVIVFGSCRITSLTGKFIVNVPIKTGLITFGHPFEIFKKAAFGTELFFDGVWTVNGSICFGIDMKLYIASAGFFEHGNLCTVSAQSKIFCSQKIVFGDYVQIGDESVLLDTNFHDLYDLKENKVIPKSGTIHLGSYVYTGMRGTIKSGTLLPDHTLVASNSLCNKDYTSFGNNILIGGIPAKFIKNEITRDWESEKKQLEDYLTIKL